MDLNEFIDSKVLIKLPNLDHFQAGLVKKFSDNKVFINLNNKIDQVDKVVTIDLYSTDCIYDFIPPVDLLKGNSKIAYRCSDDYLFKYGLLIENLDKQKYEIKQLDNTNKSIIISRPNIRVLRSPWFDEINDTKVSIHHNCNNSENYSNETSNESKSLDPKKKK